MTISNFSELKTAVDNWLARTDLSTRVPEFIALAEARIHYGSRHQTFSSPPLRLRAMEASVNLIVQAAQEGGTSAGSANAQTLVLSGYTLSRGATVNFTVGSGLTNTSTVTLNIESTGATAVVKAPGATVLAAGDLLAGQDYTVYYDGTNQVLLSDQGVPLPADFLGMRRLYLDGDPKNALDQLAPPDLHMKWAGSQTGVPKAYAIESDTIVFGPRPDASYSGKALYYRKLPALSDTVTVNWLLTNNPGVYLNGALLEAAAFIRNWERAEMAHAMYSGLCEGLDWANSHDRYGAAPLVVRSDSGNP